MLGRMDGHRQPQKSPQVRRTRLKANLDASDLHGHEVLARQLREDLATVKQLVQARFADIPVQTSADQRAWILPLPGC